jgi:hypothetical protein
MNRTASYEMLHEASELDGLFGMTRAPELEDTGVYDRIILKFTLHK